MSEADPAYPAFEAQSDRVRIEIDLMRSEILAWPVQWLFDMVDRLILAVTG